MLEFVDDALFSLPWYSGDLLYINKKVLPLEVIRYIKTEMSHSNDHPIQLYVKPLPFLLLAMDSITSQLSLFSTPCLLCQYYYYLIMDQKHLSKASKIKWYIYFSILYDAYNFMPMCNLVKNFECQCPRFHARPVQRLLQRKKLLLIISRLKSVTQTNSLFNL